MIIVKNTSPKFVIYNFYFKNTRTKFMNDKHKKCGTKIGNW